jgi:hypothetical protein
MRFLLKVNIPVEAGKAILADPKPEVVYFTDDNGQRTGFIFLDTANDSASLRLSES